MPNGEVREAKIFSWNIFRLEHAEADTFYCFTNLMIHIRDNFMKVYDHSEFGILQRMQRFNALLKQIDGEVHDSLEKQKLKPEFYAFRWLTLLLSQEFHLPDVLRLWDSLFADQERNLEFLHYVCSAMVRYENRIRVFWSECLFVLAFNEINS